MSLHRFPREIISHGVWLYHRFSLSLRDARRTPGSQVLLRPQQVGNTPETISALRASYYCSASYSVIRDSPWRQRRL